MHLNFWPSATLTTQNPRVLWIGWACATEHLSHGMAEVWQPMYLAVRHGYKLKQSPVRPNHSLNRTHCGMRLKALHFILGL